METQASWEDDMKLHTAGDDLQTSADYTVTETFTADVRQREDHTFCGLVFDVECRKDGPPLEHLLIQAVKVRGQLGPMAVYVTPESYKEKVASPDEWQKVHDDKHDASPDILVPLEFKTPVKLTRGDRCGVYVHSRLPGDQAVVYDDQRGHITHRDTYLNILPGMAHLNPMPFVNLAPWGSGGWRRDRQLAGSVVYGVRFSLWTPDSHAEFPPDFRRLCALTLWALDLVDLPLDLAMTVLNMCRHDWAADPILAAGRPIGEKLLLAPVKPGDGRTYPKLEAVVTVDLELVRKDAAGVEHRRGKKDITFELGDTTGNIDGKYHHALASMTLGETAYVLDEPQKAKRRRKMQPPAAAAAAAASQPGTRPAERVLLTLKAVANPPSPDSLDFAGRLDAAQKRRADGDALLAAGRYAFAKVRYDRGFEYLQNPRALQLSEAEYSLMVDLAVALLVGSGQAGCGLLDYDSAMPNADLALRFDPDNVEALLVSAQCRRSRGEFRRALSHVNSVLKVDPGNQAAAEMQKGLQDELGTVQSRGFGLFSMFPTTWGGGNKGDDDNEDEETEDTDEEEEDEEEDAPTEDAAGAKNAAGAQPQATSSATTGQQVADSDDDDDDDA